MIIESMPSGGISCVSQCLLIVPIWINFFPQTLHSNFLLSGPTMKIQDIKKFLSSYFSNIWKSRKFFEKPKKVYILYLHVFAYGKYIQAFDDSLFHRFHSGTVSLLSYMILLVLYLKYNILITRFFKLY